MKYKKSNSHKKSCQKKFLFKIKTALLVFTGVLTCCVEASSQEGSIKQEDKNYKQSHFIQKIYSQHWPFALPVQNRSTHVLLLHNLFVIQFDLEKKFPVFIAYFLSPQIIWGRLKAKRDYILDPLLNKGNTLSDKDYRGASSCDKNQLKGYKKHTKFKGYDRGHLAPLGSFKASPYAYEAQYMSNIVPQNRNLNQGPWRKLEELVREFVKKGNEVKILTGTIFGKEGSKTPPCWKKAQAKIIEIPKAYFKIISTYKNSKFSICSVIMPQNSHRKAHPKTFVVSLTDIDNQTSLNILSTINSLRFKENCSFLWN